MLARDLATALDPARLMQEIGLNPDPWQAEVLRTYPNRALLLCCRQSGKSTTTACMALHEAIYRPPALVLLLSPSLRQSGELFRKVMNSFRQLGETVPTEAESALRLELANGSRIVSLPGKEATVRGFSGVRLLVIDEAARVPEDLYYAVRPMLAVSGGRLVALSTPFGQRGWFYEAWEHGGDWQRVKVTARECARIFPAFLEEERAAMLPWVFAQEYLCSFEVAEGNVFAPDLIQAALSADVMPLFSKEGVLDADGDWS